MGPVRSPAVTVPHDDPSGRVRRITTRALSVLGVAVAVAGLLFAARTLLEDRGRTADLLAEAYWWWLVPATPAALVAMVAVGLPWRSTMSELGDPRGRGETLRWFFPGQLGKYVPGGIWPVVGRSELAARDGVSRPVAYAGSALSLGLSYLAALLVVLALVVWVVLTGDPLRGDLWVLLLIVPGLVVLHPSVLRWFATAAERVLSRDVPVRIPPYRATLRLLALHTPSWPLVAAATWLTARAFDPSPPVAQVALAAVLSWIVGFVVIPAPGGIGVREAAFVAAATSMAPDAAAATALTVRLVFVLADVVGAALVVLLIRRRPGTSPTAGRTRGQLGREP